MSSTAARTFVSSSQILVVGFLASNALTASKFSYLVPLGKSDALLAVPLPNF